MLKVLLADDSILTLTQLNELLSQMSARAVVVGQTMDGRQAVEFTLRLRPDLVLMDVEMPVMNGIEATEQIRERSPSTKILALSNYDSFQYLRGMMKAGAVDYLLKHELSHRLLGDKLKEIELLLTQESETVIREQYFSLVAKQSFFASLVSNVKMDAAYRNIMLRQKEFASSKAAFTILRVVNYPLLYRHASTGSRKNLIQSVLNICSNVFATIQNGLIASLDHGEFVILFNLDQVISQKKMQELLLEYLALIKGNLKRMLGMDSLYDSCFVYNSLSTLPQCYERLSLQMGGKALDEISLGTVPQLDILDERELINSFERLDLSLCQQVLSRIFAPLSDGRADEEKPAAQKLASDLILLLERYLRSQSMSTEMQLLDRQRKSLSLHQSAQALYQAVTTLFSNVLGSISCKNFGEFSPHIQRSILYIKKHYSENISLSDVADQVGLSSTYFSKVFKAEVGSTFIDYLTALRIDKAKLLLTVTPLSLNEISRQTGFGNYNYFIRIFREQAGLTPVQYQKQNKK